MRQFDKQYTFIENYLRSYGHRVHPADTDDIFQASVLRAIERGDSHESVNFFGYLAYSCLDFFKVLKKRNYKQLKNFSDKSSTLFTSEDFELLDKAIADLPENQRQAITCALRGLDGHQIAAVTSTNFNVACINRCRAVKTLRIKLG